MSFDPTILKNTSAYASEVLSPEATVFLFYRAGDNSELHLFSSTHTDIEFSVEPTRQALIQEAVTSYRSHLVLDMKTDSRLRGLRSETAESALCIPVQWKSRIVGILYAESKSWNREFNQTNLKKLEQYTSKVAANWPHDESDVEVSITPLVAVLTKTGLTFVVMLVVGLGVWSALPSKPPEPLTESVVTPQTAEAETVARSYLMSLKVRQWESAYYFLHDQVKQRLTLEDYEISMNRWADQEQNAWSLKSISLKSVHYSENSARADLVTTKPDGESSNWQLLLAPEGSSWRITESQGGPPIHG